MKALRRLLALFGVMLWAYLLRELEWASFFVYVFSLIFGLGLILLLEGENKDRGHWRRTLELCRQQRHDFLNHLQVVLGWLQLGRPERAITYIHEAREIYDKERQLFFNGNQELAINLLEVRYLGLTKGVRIEVSVNRVTREEFLASRRLARFIRALLLDLLAQAERATVGKIIRLVLGEEEGAMAIWIGLAGIALTEEMMKKWQRRAAARGFSLFFSQEV